MFKSFAKEVIKPLDDHEVYIAMTAARNKYARIDMPSQEILDKKILKSSDPDLMTMKLKKLGVIEDHGFPLFTEKRYNEPIKKEWCALYIDLYPKNGIKAADRLLKKIHGYNEQTINTLKNSKEPNWHIYTRLETEAFSSFAQSNSRVPYVIVDIDIKDFDYLHQVVTNIDSKVDGSSWPIWVTETRGGYHCIYLESDQLRNVIGNEILPNYKYAEGMKKQGQTPVPGSVQGGHLVEGVVL